MFAALALLSGAALADDRAEFEALLKELAEQRNFAFEVSIETRFDDEGGLQYSGTMQGKVRDHHTFWIRYAALWSGGWMTVGDGDRALYDPLDDQAPGVLFVDRTAFYEVGQLTALNTGGPLVALFSGDQFFHSQAESDSQVTIERSADDTEWTVHIDVNQSRDLRFWFVRKEGAWQPSRIEHSNLEGSGFRRIFTYEILSWGPLDSAALSPSTFSIEAILRNVRWIPQRT